MAAPIPLDAPVTIATLPVSLPIYVPLQENILCRSECDRSSQTDCRSMRWKWTRQGFISSKYMNY
jgi:hypothetical protein